MRSYSESMYWKTNKKWYRANYETNCYELTELAPPRAIRSFRLYKRQNRTSFLRKLYHYLVEKKW